MKLFDSLLLALGVAFTLIGIYEVFSIGTAHAYSFLMLATVVFLWFLYRKRSKA